MPKTGTTNNNPIKNTERNWTSDCMCVCVSFRRLITEQVINDCGDDNDVVDDDEHIQLCLGRETHQ